MKIGCHCGATISDSSDYVAHKAHLTPDQDIYGVWDGIDDEVIDRVDVFDTIGAREEAGIVQQLGTAHDLQDRAKMLIAGRVEQSIVVPVDRQRVVRGQRRRVIRR